MNTNNCTLKLEGAGTPECMFRIAGVLDFATVPELHRQALELFAASDAVIVELGGVTRSNSAGLAVLIEWRHLADKSGRTLLVRNVPQNLLNLARVCELEALLPTPA